MKKSTTLSLLWATSVRLAAASTHHLFSGFFSGSTIVGLEFDGDSSLSLVNNITTSANSGSKWIALDVKFPISLLRILKKDYGTNIGGQEKKKNLYVATTGYFQSYTVTSELGLKYQGNVSLSSDCALCREPYRSGIW